VREDIQHFPARHQADRGVPVREGDAPKEESAIDMSG
jgi:hypothetical protein